MQTLFLSTPISNSSEKLELRSLKFLDKDVKTNQTEYTFQLTIRYKMKNAEHGNLHPYNLSLNSEQPISQSFLHQLNSLVIEWVKKHIKAQTQSSSGIIIPTSDPNSVLSKKLQPFLKAMSAISGISILPQEIFYKLTDDSPAKPTAAYVTTDADAPNLSPSDYGWVKLP